MRAMVGQGVRWLVGAGFVLGALLGSGLPTAAAGGTVPTDDGAVGIVVIGLDPAEAASCPIDGSAIPTDPCVHGWPTDPCGRRWPSDPCVLGVRAETGSGGWVAVAIS